jgi:hypothetical protein
VRTRPEAERQADVTQAQAEVMPQLWPGPEPAQADTVQLEEEIAPHAQSARFGAATPELAEAGGPARHAELQAEAGVEPSAWQPPAAEASPECGVQAAAEADEPEIEA